jgi:hypothetical protein
MQSPECRLGSAVGKKPVQVADGGYDVLVDGMRNVRFCP